MANGPNDTKAFTTASLPRPAAVPPQVPNEVKSVAAAVAAGALDSIVAAPLNPPDFVNLKPTNPNISLRWVMHTLYKHDGTQNSIRLEEAKQQGFQPALREDVQNPPLAYLQPDGRFINGDLMLMKMERKRYEGALLWKDQQAAKQILAANAVGAAKAVNAEVGYAPGGQTKIAAFVPSANDLSSFASEEGAEGL